MISTAALSPNDVVELADAIQLTPEEEHVKKALQIIEPRVVDFRPTRVGGIRTARHFDAWGQRRSGIILRLDGQEVRVPIGTLGDGTWRLFGLALAMASCRNGVLLVDEIDTGLHHSVMTKMWHFVTETARRLDVQIFATSHSRDCYESLAAVVHPDTNTKSEITIHRIEPDRPTSVAFNEQDIRNAAERGIEIR
jgi:predicted ATPase